MSVTKSMQMAHVRALPSFTLHNEDDFVLSQLCCNTFGLEETDARMQVRRKRAIFMAKARLGVRVDLATFGDNTRHPFIFSCVGLLSMSHSIGHSVYIFYP